MIAKLRCARVMFLATILMTVAMLGFVGCSGGNAPNMAPVEGEPADDPEIAAIKASGKRPGEIHKLVRETLRARQIAAAKKAPLKKRRKS